jgi:hypothetical protein
MEPAEPQARDPLPGRLGAAATWILGCATPFSPLSAGAALAVGIVTGVFAVAERRWILLAVTAGGVAVTCLVLAYVLATQSD